MEFLTTKQAAELWGISPRRVALLCAQGRMRKSPLIRGSRKGKKEVADPMCIKINFGGHHCG